MSRQWSDICRDARHDEEGKHGMYVFLWGVQTAWSMAFPNGLAAWSVVGNSTLVKIV